MSRSATSTPRGRRSHRSPAGSTPAPPKPSTSSWAKTSPGFGSLLSSATAREDKALRQLQELAHWLEDRHPGAASSLREGMEETLTVNRLGIPPALTKTLFSTNPVESMLSVAATPPET